MKSVTDALVIKSFKGNISVYFWVDSLTTLCWIRNNEPWKQFIRNRVEEILKVSSRNQWRFCPGVINPADLPSRRTRGRDLPGNLLWWEGPKFLKLSFSEWPSEISTGNAEADAYQEIVKNPPQFTFALLAKEGSGKLSNVVDFGKYSSKGKLLRVVGWCFRFINNCKEKVKVTESELKSSEIAHSEKVVIHSVQSESFESEIVYVSNEKLRVDRKPPLLVSQFNLFIDSEGILRSKSRIKNASIDPQCKEPILLPSKHIYPELIVREYHASVYHNGVRDTLNAIRYRYWILQGREIVKKLIRKCVTCKRLEGVFYNPIPSQNLPHIRVEDGPPFSNTCIDFAGPLFVTNKQSKLSEKVYICLFTCMSTRAVHLELTERSEIMSFLHAFRRFTARRGLPRTIISDNAKTFKGAMKDVRK